MTTISEAVKILLHWPVRLTSWTWDYAHRSGSSELVQRIAQKLASQSRSNSVAFFTGGLSVETEAIPSTDYCSMLYSPNYLSLAGANALFDAGFIETDICVSGLGKDGGTPMWLHAVSFTYQWYQNKLRLLQWFMEHGANLGAVHPHFNTVTGQLIVERIVLCCFVYDFRLERGIDDKTKSLSKSGVKDSMIGNKDAARDQGFEVKKNAIGEEPDWGDKKGNDWSENVGYRSDYFDNLTSEFRDFLLASFGSLYEDNCRCVCSKHGCNTVTAALKITRQAFDPQSGSFRTDFALGVEDHELKLHIIYQYFYPLGFELDRNDDLVQDMVRIFTFDRLSLTHTCHNHGHILYKVYPQEPLENDEIDDTHEIERDDITLLENLLVEFEEAWKAHQGSFLEFINGYWVERMNQAMEERGTPRPDELQRIQELGVVLGPDEPPAPELPEMPTRDPWERFKWELERIANGKEDDWY